MQSLSSIRLKQRDAIEYLLQQYFDGLYFCDVEKLSKVFHSHAQYCCAVGGEFRQLDMTQYFEVVKARISPSSRNNIRKDEIISIDIAGPETALAKVHCAIDDRFFTDFLSLILYNKQWRIISKVFHYEIIKSNTTN